MLGLLKKDLLVIYRSFGFFLFIMLLIPLTGIDVITAISLFIAALIPMILMEFDRSSGWDKMLSTLPLPKTKIILSKYFVSYALIFPMALLSLLALQILPLVGITPNLNTTFLILALCGALSFMSINNLILYIFGVEKGKIAYFVLIGLFYIVGNFILDPSVIFNSLQKLLVDIDGKLMYIILGTVAINLASILITSAKAKFVK